MGWEKPGDTEELIVIGRFMRGEDLRPAEESILRRALAQMSPDERMEVIQARQRAIEMLDDGVHIPDAGQVELIRAFQPEMLSATTRTRLQRMDEEEAHMEELGRVAADEFRQRGEGFREFRVPTPAEFWTGNAQIANARYGRIPTPTERRAVLERANNGQVGVDELEDFIEQLDFFEMQPLEARRWMQMINNLGRGNPGLRRRLRGIGSVVEWRHDQRIRRERDTSHR
jgi:hypothetical protein